MKYATVLIALLLGCQILLACSGNPKWEAHRLRAENAMAEKEYKLAEKNLNEALKESYSYRGSKPALADSFQKLGWILHRQGDETGNYEPAARIYLKELSLRQIDASIEKEKLFRVLDKLAFCYKNMEDYQKAASYYRQSIEIKKELSLGDDEKDADTYQALGVCLTESGKPVDAIPFLKKAVELRDSLDSPEDKNARFARIALAGAYRRAGMAEEALEVYSSLLSVTKDAPESAFSDEKDRLTFMASVHRLRAKSLKDLERSDEASEAIRRAGELEKRAESSGAG